MNRIRTLDALTSIAVAMAVACGGTEPSNAPPVADFTARCSQLACVFENASSDRDGRIAAYAWNFGDGATSTDSSPSHSYAAPGGDFTVTVVVTDNEGAAATLSRTVTVSADSIPPGDLPPVADFSVTCTGLACGFTDQSTDPDPGDSVVSWAWNFGDGHSSTAPSPYHTYDAPGGQFTVTLTVRDRHAAAASSSQVVNATRGVPPDRSGTYERVTPHPSTPDSRYVIRPDGTFDYIEDGASGQRIESGHWTFATYWGGWAIEPGDVLVLDFDHFQPSAFCGEAYGYFLLTGYLGIALCQPLLDAGLEEGLYASVPDPAPPHTPPPQAGEIAFVRGGSIYRANTDGTGLIQVSAGPADANPAWSPDGSRIAFTRGGGNPGLYIMNADGTNLIRRASLQNQDILSAAPTWSPDGEWIAFACFGNGDWNLCKVTAADDGSSPIVFFPRRGYLSDAAWSPDGTRIAIISDWNMFDFWFDVWLVAPDGSGPIALRSHTPLTPNSDPQYQPAWSPDGRRIALMECPSWSFFVCSSSAIAVMNADGSGLVRLAATSGLAHPTWSPDGQVVVFANGDAIEWISADGSQRGWILANGTSPAWRP